MHNDGAQSKFLWGVGVIDGVFVCVCVCVWGGGGVTVKDT